MAQFIDFDDYARNWRHSFTYTTPTDRLHAKLEQLGVKHPEEIFEVFIRCLGDNLASQIRLTPTIANLKHANGFAANGIELGGLHIVDILHYAEAINDPRCEENRPDEVYFTIAQQLRGAKIQCTFGEFSIILHPMLRKLEHLARKHSVLPHKIVSRLWNTRRAFLLLEMWCIANQVPNPVRKGVTTVRSLGGEVFLFLPNRDAIIVYGDKT